MWPDKRLLELFQIEHPIALAPMAGFGTVELAAAVSNAGGLGSIGCATMSPELVSKNIAELRRLTGKPINVNFFCHDPAKADASPRARLAREAVALLSGAGRRSRHAAAARRSRAVWRGHLRRC